MRSRKNTLGKLLVYAAAIALAVIWLTPLIWMILVSIKPKGTPVTVMAKLFSPPFTLDNYLKVLDSSIWQWSVNSLIVCGVTLLGTLVLDSMAAYALSYLQFRGKKWLFWFILAGMMVPLEAELIPLYQIMVDFGLVNQYASLILPSLAGPFGVFVLKQFFDGVPHELAEAARIDGAGVVRIYLNIFLPLGQSALVAVLIFTFIGSWNSYIWPYMAITSDKMMTVPIGLPMFQSFLGSDKTVPMAANFFASIPAIVIFLICQKHIIKGVAMSGLKG
jgi:multiple sugar transport system permease protein